MVCEAFDVQKGVWKEVC
jgi:N-acetylneuraminic acid mutarotase